MLVNVSLLIILVKYSLPDLSDVGDDRDEPGAVYLFPVLSLRMTLGIFVSSGFLSN